MKSIHKIAILFACAAIAFSACKEDTFTTYKGGADLYFTYQRPSTVGYNFAYAIDGKEYTWSTTQYNRPKDSISCTFALIPSSQRDSLLLLPVSLMGGVSNENRDIDYEIVEGDKNNFEIVKAYIPAKSDVGGIFIRLYRDALASEYDTYKLKVRLKENNDFTLRYDSIPYSTNTAEQTSVTDFIVRVTNSLEKPMYWMEPYFGKWSTVKALILMNEIGYPQSQLWPETGFPDLGMMPAYGGLLKKYLQAQIAAGTPVTYVNEKGETVEMDWGMSI